MTAIPVRLLDDDDPHPVRLVRPAGSSDFFLTCDHAGTAIPRALGDLGVSAAERRRHIGWDVGAEAVAHGLSERLDATLVAQSYSRLVIDCNRAPGHPTSITPLSELTEIPGNRDLHPEHVGAREREIFHPYHAAIVEALDARAAAGRPSLLVCVHSFTPVYKGARRPWHIGLLYNRDRRLAERLRPLLAAERDLCIGDNQPYAVSDESDYGVPVHGERRGIPHVEIEIRHDLIETPEGQSEWAERLADWLVAARDGLDG